MSEKQSLQIEVALKGMAALQADFKRGAEAIGEFGERAKEVGERLGEALGLYEIGESIKGVLEYGRALEVLQSQTGDSIPDLVIIEQLLSASGESADEAGVSIARMQRSIVDAAEEGGAALTVFQQLFGKDAMGKLQQLDVGQQFRAIGTALGTIENPAKRAQLAMEIFGRSGYTLLRIFPKLTEYEAKAREGHEEFAQVMSRGGEMFRSMEVALQMLGQTTREFFAGLLDTVGPMFQELMDKISSFDLTKVGQNIGAFVAVVVQAIRDNRLPELIGLLVEAGFELGAIGAKKIILGIGAFFESQAFASAFVAVTNGVVTLVEKVGELWVSGFASVVALALGNFDYLFDHLREMVENLGQQLKHIFAVAINFWAEGIENVINKLARNKYFQALLDMFTPGGANLAGGGGIHLGRVSESTSAVAPAMDTMAATDKIASLYTSITSQANSKLQQQLAGFRELLHLSTQLTEKDNGRAAALQRILALIDAQLKARREMGAGEGGGSSFKVNDFLSSTAMQMAVEFENSTKARIESIKTQLGMVETDFTKTAEEKWGERKKLLEAEAGQYQLLIESMTKRAELLDKIGRFEDAEKVRSQITGVQGQMGGIGKESNQLGADPNSFAQQFQAALVKMETSWGTLAEQIANFFTKTITTGINTVSSNLTDVIMKTKNWSMALRDIGNTIMRELINSIIQMGIEFVLQHTLIRAAMWATAAIGKALGWSQVADSNAQEASKAPALAANAASASVGSFGTSAILGTIAAVAAFGLITAAALGAFAEGGYTGAGGKWEPAGIVHRGEYVMPASAVQRIGLSRLESMRSGASGEGNTIPMVGGAAHHINVFDDRSAMAKHIRDNPDVQHSIIDLVAGNTHKFIPRRVG